MGGEAHVKLLLPLLLLSFVLPGCAKHPAVGAAAATTTTAPTTAAPTTAAPNGTPARTDGTAPRPFTPKQLHDAFGDGAEMRYRITTPAGTVIKHTTFVAPTDDEVTLRAETLGPDGARLSADDEQHARWTELVDHAAFPAVDTTITDGVAEVPAGRFTTRVYTVNAKAEDGTPEIERYAFVPTLPGPPVLFTIEQGGAEVFRMELVERKPMP
jgi:hypothetical protein